MNRIVMILVAGLMLLGVDGALARGGGGYRLLDHQAMSKISPRWSNLQRETRPVVLGDTVRIDGLGYEKSEVRIANPAPIMAQGNDKKLSFGDVCSVADGGAMKVVGQLPQDASTKVTVPDSALVPYGIIVRYTASGRKTDESHCPIGTLFFVLPETFWLLKDNEELKRKQDLHVLEATRGGIEQVKKALEQK